VPLTEQLTEALKTARHLRGPRVICDDKGQPLTQKIVQVTVRRVARRAQVKPGVHILRHTFCSHLAMRGAPARAIQELAGHQDRRRRSAICISHPLRSSRRSGC
jgi:site-specific recombinase XerD